MINRLIWAGLVAMVLAVPAGGCSGLDRYYQGDCDSLSFGGRNGVGCCAGGACTDGGCDDGSCEGGDCGGPACGGCGSCGACCPNPFKSLWRAITCSSGCGDFYFDEWINDPPEKCDPCNDQGGYIGPQESCPRWFHGLAGQRGGGCGCSSCSARVSSCGTPGCTSCGGGQGHAMEEETSEEVEDVAPQKMQPTPATQTARRPKPYYTPESKQASHSQHVHSSPAKPQPRVLSSATRTAKLQPTPAQPVGSGKRTVH